MVRKKKDKYDILLFKKIKQTNKLIINEGIMEIFLNKKKKSRIYVDFFLPKKKKKINQTNT